MTDSDFKHINYENFTTDVVTKAGRTISNIGDVYEILQ